MNIALRVALGATVALISTIATARPLFYVSGNLETGPAGSTLDAPLVVRNGFSDERMVGFEILHDSTGGARFSTGGSLRVVSVGGGEAASEALTFGPSAGVVGVIACVGTMTTGGFECRQDTPADFGAIQLFSLIATGPTIPTSGTNDIAYVSGTGQVGTPGSTLAESLAGRNASGSPGEAVIAIINDDTGGARFADGTTQRTITFATGATHAETLTLGPNSGLVQVLVCSTEGGALDCDDAALVFVAESRGANEPVVTCSGVQHAGTELTLAAPDGAMRYDWDVDGDGVMDRTGADNELPLTYPSAFSDEITVMITDAAGMQTTTTRTISTIAPDLDVSVSGAPTQVCGDGDANPEPGERWSLPVQVANEGAQASEDGFVAFAPTDRVTASGTGMTVDGALEVEQPAIAVGNLAPGAFVARDVQVTLKPTALCGTSYGVNYTGSVDRISSAQGNTAPLAQFATPVQCQVFTGACPVAKAQPVVPRQGLYLNSNRAGNGLSNFLIPSPSGGAPTFFGAWFTAANDRSPTWYVIQGPMVGNVVVAPILRFTRDVNAQRFTVSSTRVGQAVIGLLGTQRMLLSYDIGGRQGSELMDYFVGGPAPSPNRSGAWFNVDEGGWGQVIHQYVADGVQSTFAVHYIYDAAGQPRWVLGQGSTAALAAPSAHTTFRVHCPGCPQLGDWAELPIAAGTGSVLFQNATTGVVTTSFALPAPFAGPWTRTNLPITVLTAPQ